MGGWGMFLYELICKTADKYGASRALFYRDTYLSFRGLLHRVDRRASELLSFGIKEGDTVGLMLGNVPEYLILLLALSKLKTTVVPMDPTLSVREVNAVLQVVPLRALITRPKGGTDPTTTVPPLIKPVMKNPPRIEPESQRRLQGTLLTCSIYKKSSSDRKFDVPIIFLTEDARGFLKGVLRTEENIVASYEILRREIGFTEKDRLIATLPLYTSYAFENLLLVSLFSGCVLYLEDESSIARVLKIIKEQEITYFPTHPGLIDLIGKIPTLKPLLKKDVKVISSSMPLRPQTAQVFTDRFGPKVLSLYRTTETGPISFESTGDKLGTVGFPMSSVEVSLQQERVMVASSAVSTTFLLSEEDVLGFESVEQKPAKIAILKSKQLEIGDLASLDSLGQLILTGRFDGQVKIDGKRVSLLEITRCLERHPKVKRAKTMVIPDPEGILQLIAQVQLKSLCKEEELLDYCIFNLSSHKVPRRIEFVKNISEG